MKNLRSFLNLVFSIYLDLESGVYSLRTQESNRLADDQGPPKAGRASRASWSRPSIMFIPFFTRYCAVANELLCWFVRNSRLHWGEWPRETCSCDTKRKISKSYSKIRLWYSVFTTNRKRNHK